MAKKNKAKGPINITHLVRQFETLATGHYEEDCSHAEDWAFVELYGKTQELAKVVPGEYVPGIDGETTFVIDLFPGPPGNWVRAEAGFCRGGIHHCGELVDREGVAYFSFVVCYNHNILDKEIYND